MRRFGFWKPIDDSRRAEVVAEAVQELRADIEAGTESHPSQFARVKLVPGGQPVAPTIDDLQEMEQFLSNQRRQNARDAAIVDRQQSNRRGGFEVAPENAPEELRLRRERLAALEERKREEAERKKAAQEVERQKREDWAKEQLRMAGASPEEVENLYPEVMRMELLRRVEHPQPAPREYAPMVSEP